MNWERVFDGLPWEEQAMVDAMAHAEGKTRYEMLAEIVRDGLRAYASGEIDLVNTRSLH